jgi:uncharacterized membrane protein (UPF0127 family)
MKIRLRNSVIEADVADDLVKRAIGLSLSEKKNMFFSMPYESRWSLWMFAVRYPIRMVFIGRDRKVVDIKKAVPITTDPKTWKVYTPKESCMYILETPFDLKINIGDRLSW